MGSTGIEIELKARVSDMAAAASALDSFMERAGSVDKRDEYWGFQPPEGRGSTALRFRIREEEGSIRITFKEKTLRGAIEVNRETEFDLTGEGALAAFKAFVAKAGASAIYRKRKKGKAWRKDRMLAELVEVENLGAFLEIETVRDSESSQVVEEASTALRDALARCGLREADLEPRPYSELLGIINQENGR